MTWRLIRTCLTNFLLAVRRGICLAAVDYLMS
jgi:hypothetical protein